MTTEKKRAIPWKEGKVISIQLRNGKYVLAQMLKAPDIVFFNLFNNDNNWKGTELSEDKILFCRSVVRQFIKCSPITVIKDVLPLENYKLPTIWIHAEGYSQRKLIKFDGNEYLIGFLGDYFSLVERDMENHTNNTDISGLYKKKLLPRITSQDWDKVENVEDMSLDVYPLLNERLYLCYLKGKNVNPFLDLKLGKNLPDFYESYFAVMVGKREEFGYD